jgi:cellobiose PTS system EIIB component
MNIMLACCAGMSTSLVVGKMEEAAKAQGKDYKIWAVEQGQVANELGNFDVLLLGPQVRHMLRKLTKTVDGKAPVAVIDPVAYGRCDGAAVLKQAEDLVNGK